MTTASNVTARTVVIGIGLSSKATADEVRDLVQHALADRELDIADVRLVATRDRFVGDRRVDLGLPVRGVTDERLIAESASCNRPFGLQARVAETAAAVAAGSRNALIGHVDRSAHATVAVAQLYRNGALR
jgi:cobalamin biosynthesis protein CbiG